MSSDDTSTLSQDERLSGLSPEQKAELERNGYAVVADEVIWMDRERGLRREPMSRLYYIQTEKGVFRVSRITREVIEV
jgi:hypothetical protein